MTVDKPRTRQSTGTPLTRVRSTLNDDVLYRNLMTPGGRCYRVTPGTEEWFRDTDKSFRDAKKRRRRAVADKEKKRPIATTKDDDGYSTNDDLSDDEADFSISPLGPIPTPADKKKTADSSDEDKDEASKPIKKRRVTRRAGPGGKARSMRGSAKAPKRLLARDSVLERPLLPAKVGVRAGICSPLYTCQAGGHCDFYGFSPAMVKKHQAATAH